MHEGITAPLSRPLPAVADPAAPQTGEEVCLPNASGLHARPAAQLVALAKKFKSEITLARADEQVSAKSVVAILGLATQCGDRLRVRASGVDAAQAVAALTAMLAEGCGEAPTQSVATLVSVPVALMPAPAVAATAQHELGGVCASPGLAVGRIVQYRRQQIELRQQAGAPAQERDLLERVLQQAIKQLELLRGELSDPLQRDLLKAHQELLQDPQLCATAFSAIDQGCSAEAAWQTAFASLASRFECAASEVLRERAHDIRDIGQRVLLLLSGASPGRIELTEAAILIAEELTPSDTVTLDRSNLLGFCTTTGGASSHVAILARSFGIPAICAIDGRALALENGTLVVLDGSRARLNGKPSELDVAQARERLGALAIKTQQEQGAAGAPALMRDGQHIEVVANVCSALEAQQAVAAGAEGVGLLRSEFLFEARATAPDEDEQAQAYLGIAKALGTQRSLIVRTLDVGGDKPLPYLVLPREDNPFLGLRGVRVSLEQPEMFRTQLRAILRASGHTRLHIMFPMIATLEELRQAKAMLAQEQAALGLPALPVGVMIEVPSAALLASQLAREADFFSIGSNDLTQYTLAMDRGHPKLASQADALHPAVLRMMALACEGAHEHGKWVGLCGALASEPLAVPLLIGLGVSELSVSVPAVAAVKARIRRLSLAACRSLAKEVLAMSSAVEVRERLAAWDLVLD